MNQTVLLGIAMGLGAALFQSLSYVCCRLYLKHHSDNAISLLALSHIMMGLVSIPIAVFLWPASMPALSQYGLSLLGSAGFYLLGQVFLFTAIIHSEPSRVSPLLGLKVLMLSVFGLVFFHQPFTLAKWIAVAFSTVAALLLSYNGKRLERRFVVLGLLACLCYCLSDMNIKTLVDHFSFMDGTFKAASMATALCYMVCGLVGAVIVAFKPAFLNRQTWLFAMPFAASWFLGMIFLFSCFGFVGVVYGNILQSTRGIISIVLGFVIAHIIGLESLESKCSKAMILKRIAAAILMTAAVVLFLK